MDGAIGVIQTAKSDGTNAFFWAIDDNTSAMPTVNATNYEWYRIFSDGWVIQGGQFTNTVRLTTIVLPITMANAGYSITTTYMHAEPNYSSAVSIGVQTGTIKVDSFVCEVWYSNTNTHGLNGWKVEGQKA